MSTGHRRIPWELIGLLIVVAVFAIGAVFWFASPRGRGELVAPESLVLDEGSAAHGVTPDGRPYLGEPDAPVRVIEIADFQCPFCRDFVMQDFAALKRDYMDEGTVRWELYSVGFDGNESLAAGIAGVCAARQGAFWPMHDWLYANASVVIDSGAFSRDRLLMMAANVGLDVGDFEACLDDPSAEQLVLDNEAFARRLGVTASPTFVVGDRLVEGRDIKALRALIDASIDE